MTCASCDTRPECSSMCDGLKKELKKVGVVMEKHCSKEIRVYPKEGKKVVQFCDLSEMKLDSFSQDDRIVFNSDAVELLKTSVFIDRVFNRLSNQEIADKHGVDKNTIATIFKDSVDKIDNFIETMDIRREGIKSARDGKYKFSRSEQFFLLHHVFRYNKAEIASIFGIKRGIIDSRVEGMARTYRKLFDGHQVKPFTDNDDLLSGQDLIDAVQNLVGEGMSQTKAIKAIASETGETFLAVNVRYYKAKRKVDICSTPAN